MPPTPPPRRQTEPPLYQDVVTEQQDAATPGTRGGYGGDDDMDERYRYSEPDFGALHDRRPYDRRLGGYATRTGDPGPRAESFRGVGPRDYRRADERIREEVCERLTEDARLDASGIDVAVAGGEVTLGGVVRSRECRRRAAELVRPVLGIGRVRNNLRVAASFLQWEGNDA